MYLIAGANGCGKTTFAKELLKDEPALVFVNHDEIVAKLGDEVGIRSGKRFFKILDDIFENKSSFAMESTIAGTYHKRIMERAKKAKYEIIMVYVFLDFPDLGIARVYKRVADGGHYVAPVDVVRRFYRSRTNFSGTVLLADRWKLYYNGDNNYELVAKSDGQVVQVVDESLYNQFKKDLKGEKDGL